MKIRNGFVSNSSSASFIIKMSTTLSDDVVEMYIKQSDDYFEKYWHGGKIEKWDLNAGFTLRDPKTMIVDKAPLRNEVYNRVDDTIEIKVSTSMFNDWIDVPAWKFIRAVNEKRFKGLKLEKIIQTEDEYMDCDEEVEFNHQTWEYEDKAEEGQRRQNEIDIEYQSYLIKSGYIPTQEEIIEFTKNQLNQ